MKAVKKKQIMKRVIQILLFIAVVILTYMCIASIRQGMENEEETPVYELFEK
jgi:hypothetical protein